jgi:hypothetical protein
MLKGDKKKEYQRTYMRGYMRNKRARVLTEGLNKTEVLTPKVEQVLTSPPKKYKKVLIGGQYFTIEDKGENDGENETT